MYIVKSDELYYSGCEFVNDEDEPMWSTSQRDAIVFEDLVFADMTSCAFGGRVVKLKSKNETRYFLDMSTGEVDALMYQLASSEDEQLYDVTDRLMDLLEEVYNG